MAAGVTGIWLLSTRGRPREAQETIDALVGEYDPPIDGILFTVTAHAGKVYVAQTGNPPEEIKPYKLTDNVIGFNLKRDRLDFAREHGAVTRLVYKSPFMTLEAPRKG